MATVHEIHFILFYIYFLLETTSIYYVTLSMGQESKYVLCGYLFYSFFFFSFLKLFYCCSITVLCIFPQHSPPPQPNPPPLLPPFCLVCPCVLYSSSWKPFPPLSPPTSPLAIVRSFLISMSLVIFYLLFFLCWLCSMKYILDTSKHELNALKTPF